MSRRAGLVCEASRDHLPAIVVLRRNEGAGLAAAFVRLKGARRGCTSGGAPVSATRMNPTSGYRLITPDDLAWRPSNLMRIPNADYLERTGSDLLGARLWRLPPKSANTLHKHVVAEEFYFVLEGVGRLRVGDETLTVPRHGGVWVGPALLRQVFNDTEAEVLWLIVGAPEEKEFLQGTKSQTDLSRFYPVDPARLPPELAGVQWPPKS